MNSATPNGGEPMVPAGRTREVSAEPDAEEIASAVDPVHSTHSSGREKVAKGDRNGIKAERPNTRIVPKSRFRRLATIEEVAAALFGGLGAATVTPGGEAAHCAVLLRHLRGERQIIPAPRR